MERSLDRRTFTLEFALAALSGAVITISGCGGGSSGSPSGPSGGGGGKTGSISANHGHTAFITSAELTAGNAVTLNIRGQATHDHIVTLSAADVMAIAANQRVSTTSSVGDANAHNHTVTFN